MQVPMGGGRIVMAGRATMKEDGKNKEEERLNNDAGRGHGRW